MLASMTPYALLAQRFDRHYLLKSSADVLEWDAQAMMPEGGGDLRAAQLGTLRLLAHEAIADARHGGAPRGRRGLAARGRVGAREPRGDAPRLGARRRRSRSISSRPAPR